AAEGRVVDGQRAIVGDTTTAEIGGVAADCGARNGHPGLLADKDAATGDGRVTDERGVSDRCRGRTPVAEDATTRVAADDGADDGQYTLVIDATRAVRGRVATQGGVVDGQRAGVIVEDAAAAAEGGVAAEGRVDNAQAAVVIYGAAEESGVA